MTDQQLPQAPINELNEDAVARFYRTTTADSKN